jgi:hypothetical protein
LLRGADVVYRVVVQVICLVFVRRVCFFGGGWSCACMGVFLLLLLLLWWCFRLYCCVLHHLYILLLASRINNRLQLGHLRIWKRVTRRRSNKSNAGTNSVGKTTWKLSNCFLVASDKLFSGLVLVSALSLVAAAAWSLGSVDSE